METRIEQGVLYLDDALLDRMERAVAKVRDRLVRASRALAAAGIPFAVTAGNAVAAWVGTRDESAVRNTRDVDLLVARDDLDAIRRVLEAEGFVFRHVAGIDRFLDGPVGKAGDGIHLVFAGERVLPDHLEAQPGLGARVDLGELPVLDLESLVRAKLIAWRRKDQVHLQDLIQTGLVDATWPARYPDPLAARLQELLDDPFG